MKLKNALLGIALSLCHSLMWSQSLDPNPLVKKVNHTQTDWYLEMQSARPNWFKVEQLYRDYFKNHTYERSPQRRQCERWLHVTQPLINTEGYMPPIEWTEKDFQPKAQPLASRGLGNDIIGTWRMIGPYKQEKSCNGSGSTPMPGGFADRVYINPYNTSNLFSAQSYGGIWVSKDKGATWKLTDAEFPNGTNSYANRDYYYGEIEANKLNSNLIYIATEAGLLKSINGGDTWTLCPQLNRTANTNLRPYYIAQALDNQTTILATFGRKLYRSTDAGQTWSIVFDNETGGSNRTGTNQHSVNAFGLYDRTYNFWGLTQHPTNAATFYLGVINSSNEPCIYKSTDSGASFSLLANLKVKLNKTSFPLMQMKTAQNAPSKIIVYGLFENSNIYKFNENGDLLETITNAQSYFESADIDFLDENKVYNGVYLNNYTSKSIDGGKTFTDSKGDCNIYIHADPRSVSAVGDMILVGTDGGVYLSTDGGKTYPSVGDDISAIDLWGFASSFKSDIVLVGCDHGPNMLRTADTLRAWKRLLGADAGASTINPANENLMYLDWGYGKSKGELKADGTLSLTNTTNDISFHKIEFNPLIYTTSYGIAGNQVKISTDNLTTNSVFYDFGVSVTQFKVALKDTNTMYVLLQNRTLKKSKDAGKTWTDITPSTTISKNQTSIAFFEIGKNPDDVWVAYGGKQNTCKILKTTTGGTNWTDLTGNLPTAPISQITFQRGTEGGLYVATQGNGGVWYRNNTLTSWQALGQGLPMLGYVQQIYTVPAKNKYRMGSSRGAWEHDLYEKSGLDAFFSVNSRSVYCKDVVSFRDYSAYSPTSSVKFNWTFTGGTPATSTEENPKVSYANATPGKYKVSLTITDNSGATSTYTMDNFIEVIASENCIVSPSAGKALDLSTNSVNLSLPSIPIKQLPFTITAWVKPIGAQKSFSQIIGQANAPRSAGLPHFSLGFAFQGYTANTNLVFTAQNVSYGLTTTHNLPANEWSHIAAVVEATKVTLYLNGNSWVYNGTITAPDLGLYPLFINADIHGQGGSFKGLIDEIAIYNAALSQDSVRASMHLTKRGTEPNLLAYYQFNQYANNKVFEPIKGYDIPNVASSLIQPISNAPVASGTSQIYSGSNTSIDLANTHLSAQLNATTTNQIIAYKLDAAPNLSPNSNTTVKKHWVLRSWGSDASFPQKLQSLTFINSGLKSSSAQLFTRAANGEANDWVNTALVPSGNIQFLTANKIPNNSQLVLIGEATTPTIEINGQAVKISAVPNPTHDRLELVFQNIDKPLNLDISLIDILGKVLQTKSAIIDLHTAIIPMDLSAYPNGTYFISIRHKGQILSNLPITKLG